MLRYLAILLGATLFLVSPSAPTTAQQTDFDAIYKRFVDELYRAGNYPAALVEAQRFEAAVKARFGTNHANYAAALDNLGLVYEAQGRWRRPSSATSERRNRCRRLGRGSVAFWQLRLLGDVRYLLDR
jgi:hypothetical protein